MEEKILYILGAGASAKALPISKTVRNENGDLKIPGLAYELSKQEASFFNRQLTDQAANVPKVEEMVKRFYNLSKCADEYGDVDTYAKYLNLMNPGGNELKDLKKTLSEYFVIKQLFRKARDTRYFPWLISIMNNKTFPDNVKILSWNYDYQVELAMGQLVPMEDIIFEGSGFSHSPSTLLSFPTLDPTFSEYNRLSLIHLNGIAGFINSSFLKTGSAFQRRNCENLDAIISFMNENELDDHLHFAWEKSEYHSKLMKHTKELINGTTILVVIGYSFPFFNRQVDKQIFNVLKDSLSFKKIYFQDPVLNGNQLKAQFDLRPETDIIHIERIDSFHIPFEY